MRREKFIRTLDEILQLIEREGVDADKLVTSCKPEDLIEEILAEKPNFFHTKNEDLGFDEIIQKYATRDIDMSSKQRCDYLITDTEIIVLQTTKDYIAEIAYQNTIFKHLQKQAEAA